MAKIVRLAVSKSLKLGLADPNLSNVFSNSLTANGSPGGGPPNCFSYILTSLTNSFNISVSLNAASISDSIS